MAKLNSSESKILDQIAKWKAQTPSFLNRATNVVSAPVSWLAEKLIPESARNDISGVTELLIEKLQDFSQWSVNQNDILKATHEFEIDAETIIQLKKASIHDLDHVAEKFIGENTRMATLSGFGTGMVGIAGILADLPSLFSISMRSIYQIALCYGYDLESRDGGSYGREYEVEYMVRVFKIATASDKIQKQRALAELKDFEAGRDSEIYGELGGDFAAKQVGKNATNFISRKIIQEIVEQTLSKKAAALIPGLGAVFSAGFNYVYLKDVGEAAYMVYRERFLLDKKGRRKTIKIDIE
ncbi:MAG: EcsC family protein [Bacteroidota bacterium]